MEADRTIRVNNTEKMLWTALFLVFLSQLQCQTTPKTDVDLIRLTGIYYLVYTSSDQTPPFYCVTYQYSISDPTTVSIEKNGYRNGDLFSTTGYIALDQGTIEWTGGTPTNFTMLQLGGLDSEGQYSFLVQREGSTINLLVRQLGNAQRALEEANLSAADVVPVNQSCFLQASTTTLPSTPATSAVFKPVEELDLRQYLGLWYQIIINNNARASFTEGGRVDTGVCISVTYCYINESAVSVYNSQRVGTPIGKVDDITGTAVTTVTPGVLSVKFDGIDGTFPYWVIALGPVEDEFYQYAIVSDPNQSLLFVLTRDIGVFYDNYLLDVLLYLEKLGFTSEEDKPRIVYHDRTCEYPRNPTPPRYAVSGCVPEVLDAGFWVAILAVGLILGFAGAAVATFFIWRRKRGCGLSYNNF